MLSALYLKVQDLETVSNIQSSEIKLLTESLKELSLNSANGFTSAFTTLKRVSKNISLLNQKIQALATTLVKETDVDPDDIEDELESIKMYSMDIDEEIQKLIKDTNPYDEN